jgi:ribonuclease Z
MATALGNGGFAVERVLLTHGHIDHISGLPSLLWSRAAGMGDTEKPIEIYYPRGDMFVADMQAYLERTSTHLPFSLQWIPLDAGASFALVKPAAVDKVARQGENNEGATKQTSQNRGARRVVTVATQHIRGRLTLGYKVVETRRRLKPEYASLSQEEIRSLAQREGREAASALSEDHEAILAAFGGDGLALKPDDVRGCELLMHEATIIDAAERKHQLHATLDEAVQVAAEVAPKALVLYHVSGRYRASDIQQAVGKSAHRHGVTFPIWCLFRDRLWNVTEPRSSKPSVARAKGAE